MKFALVVSRRREVGASVRRAMAPLGIRVVVVPDGLAAVRMLAEFRPDALIIDPPVQALSVASLAAATAVEVEDCTVVVLGTLTTTSGVWDWTRVSHLPWPASIEELLNAVQLSPPHAQGRPFGALEPDDPWWTALGVTQSERPRRVRHRGRDVRLSARENALIDHLAARRGAICSRRELLAAVWGISFDPGTNLVDVTLCRLRAKLPGLQLITIRGAGYLLRAQHAERAFRADHGPASSTG